jgi:serine/threonine-protein kinase RsbW
MTIQNAKEKLIISSRPENITVVENYIEGVLKTHNIAEEAYGNILISVIEGANNAILHGNKSDENKSVEISHKISDNKRTITFIISDEGGGFDYTNLPDPTSPENIENFGGRGVFLMKQLADMTIFENNGSVVELTFNI